jgi:hypothetical protein
MIKIFPRAATPGRIPHKEDITSSLSDFISIILWTGE